MESVLRAKSPDGQVPRVLFLGMQSSFSSPSLISILQSGIDVCAVVVPASPPPGKEVPPIRRLEPPTGRTILPLAHALPSIIHIAWQHKIPVWEVSRMQHAQTLAALRGYEPDMLCVACFSLRIPSSVLSVPQLGCLNVHPGLLPANRGPIPLFWTFRDGNEYAGVTIHLMEEKMDSGAILAQECFPVPDGIRYEHLEAECARRGGQLLARTAWELFAGRAQPELQDETKSSYHSFPTDTDLIVAPQEWNARHLFNFIRGISTWNGPIELHISGEQLFVQDAVSYTLDESGQMLEDSTAHSERNVRCKDGSVRVLLA